MIADTAVLGTSPWAAGDKMLYPRDSLKVSSSPDLHKMDLDIAALEAEIERSTSQSDHGSLHLNNTSCCTSVVGSECSDDVCLDIENDTQHLFPDQEYLTTNLWNLLGVNTEAPLTFEDSLMTEPFNMAVLPDMSPSPLTLDSTDLSHYDSILSVSAPASPQPRRKAQKQCKTGRSHVENHQLTTGKPWSTLSNSQQVSVIEDLTRIISNEMGLREQMEVIRIINPEASITSTDTEFVIDLDCLNNEKLEKVRSLVKQHTQSSSSSSSAAGSSSSGFSDCSSECNSPSQKKQTKQQRRNRPRQQRQRQRKEYRQMLKEKRSGLFQKEEVLALSSCVSEEEEEPADIDILL